MVLGPHARVHGDVATMGGTLVRESWDISREAPLSRPLVRRFMGSEARVNMARTLERIEQRFTS